MALFLCNNADIFLDVDNWCQNRYQFGEQFLQHVTDEGLRPKKFILLVLEAGSSS